MIRVIGKYAIDVSDRCYVVGKTSTTTVKKTGEQIEVFQRPAYCTSVAAALKALRKMIHMDALKNYEGDLEGAIKLVQAADEKMEKEFEKLKF